MWNCKRYFSRKKKNVIWTYNFKQFCSLSLLLLHLTWLTHSKPFRRETKTIGLCKKPLTWMANMASSAVYALSASFAMGTQASPRAESRSSGNEVHQAHSFRAHHFLQVRRPHRRHRDRCHCGSACYCLLTYFEPSVVDARPALGPICWEREEKSIWKTNLINIYLRA